MTTAARAPLSQSIIAALSAITRRQVAVTFLLGCAYFLYRQGQLLQMMLQIPNFSGRPALLTFTFVGCQLGAFSLLGCIAVAEQTAARAARQGAYFVAIVASAVIAGAALMIPRYATFWVGPPGNEEEERAPQLLDAAWVGFFQWLILGGAATFIYVDRRRAHAAQARMHAAQIERTRAAKRTLESRLQAMQARVEPQFLFNTLAQVHDLYRVDPARGERMLDELIAYLRAAMPKMRDTSSTVGQEMELVRAYLAIVRLRLGGRLAYEIAPLDPSVAEARMPPMMLLPLVDHAIAHGFTEPKANGSLRVRAEAANGIVRLEIEDTGAGFLAEKGGEAIEGIRERLLALYGAAAGLVLKERDEGGTKALLELPVDSAAAESPEAFSPRPRGGVGA